MSWRGKIIVILAVIIFLALQAQKLVQPFVGEFEAGFQEMIAQHHLESGIVNNHFLPVIAEINGEKFYHTAHPPLLHIIYALLYRMFGEAEWVTRGFCLLLLFGSIFLLSQLLSKEKRAIFWLIALFFPISFRLGLVTNYEPLTIFSICLFLFCFEKARPNFSIQWLMAIGLCLLFIALSDWPAYLAVPALFLIHLREPKERKWLAGLFIAEVILFGALILYMKSIAGEVALFAHSETRSNPIYLFQLATYQEFFEHLKWITGAPALILIVFAFLALLIPSPLRGGDKGEGENFQNHQITPSLTLPHQGGGIAFWAIFLILLWLSAANLASRHFVYLLYFFPLSALILTEAISRINHRKLATLAVWLSFISPDYTGLSSEDARFYYLGLYSNRSSDKVKSCFSTAALGAAYFYDKIETVVPVSKKATESLNRLDYDLLILDRQSAEVKDLSELISKNDYQLRWEFDDLSVYFKEKVGFQYLSAQEWNGNGPAWSKPRAEVIYSLLQADYGIRQPPGPEKISKLTSSIEGKCFDFNPLVLPKEYSGKSDGVNFLIIGDSAQGRKLLFSKFWRAPEMAQKYFKLFRYSEMPLPGWWRYEIPLADLSKINLITEAGPRGDYNYDDAYWVEPIFKQKCSGGSGQWMTRNRIFQ